MRRLMRNAKPRPFTPMSAIGGRCSAWRGADREDGADLRPSVARRREKASHISHAIPAARPAAGAASRIEPTSMSVKQAAYPSA